MERLFRSCRRHPPLVRLTLARGRQFLYALICLEVSDEVVRSVVGALIPRSAQTYYIW